MLTHTHSYTLSASQHLEADHQQFGVVEKKETKGARGDAAAETAVVERVEIFAVQCVDQVFHLKEQTQVLAPILL